MCHHTKWDTFFPWLPGHYFFILHGLPDIIFWWHKHLWVWKNFLPAFQLHHKYLRICSLREGAQYYSCQFFCAWHKVSTQQWLLNELLIFYTQYTTEHNTLSVIPPGQRLGFGVLVCRQDTTKLRVRRSGSYYWLSKLVSEPLFHSHTLKCLFIESLLGANTVLGFEDVVV